jgi:small subunit ribosomal protein S8
MLTDPIADMLTRIRNASAIEAPLVEMPSTKLKQAIAAVLQGEGFIYRFQVGKYTTNDDGQKEFVTTVDPSKDKVVLRVELKYGPDGERVIRSIDRASKPGRRLYRNKNQLPRVLDGLGIAILSTSKGVMSDRQARKDKVGGELICTVW